MGSVMTADELILETENVQIRIWKPVGNPYYRWEMKQRYDETWDWQPTVLSDGYSSFEDAERFARRAAATATQTMREYSPEYNLELAVEDFAYSRKAFEILEYFGIDTADILHVKSAVDFERIREQIIASKP